MRFRFVLTHDIEGELEISEPDAWKECVLKLERHEEFHSLIEYFDGSFIFYGNNGIVNGGIDFIKLVELNHGPDATLLIDIDLTFDDIVFIPVFNGQFKLTDLEEMPDNKMRLPIIRDDFWATFISRLDQVVNIQSTSDLDDNPISPAENIKVNLPSQKIRYIGSYEWEESVTYPEEDFFHGLQLDWEKVLIDDLKKFNLPRVPFNLGTGLDVSENLIGVFEAPYDGDYNFDIAFPSAEYGGAGNWFADPSNYQVQKSYQTIQTPDGAFTQNNVTIGADVITYNTFNKTINLKKGDQVAIYGDRVATSDDITIFGTLRLNWITVDLATTEPIALTGEQTIDGTLTSASTVLVKDQGDRSENGVYTTGAGAWTRVTGADTASELLIAAVYITGGTTNINTAYRQTEPSINLGVSDVVFTYTIASDERFIPYPLDEVDNHLIITGDTTYPETDAEGFLLHDVGAAISDRIIGSTGTFYSELLGAQYTLARQYESNGCAAAYGLCQGLQIRRYSLDEKSFFKSFNQWWKGINPILNLSLMYDTIDGQPVIRVEDKAYQYDDSITSVYLSNIRNITRKYDNDVLFNKVEIGYTRWQGEDISGIDDPQTKKIYYTRFKKIGKSVQIHSEFIAASLVWESARRLTREKSTDYKYDNETFIIALNPDYVISSPDSPDVLLFDPEFDENFSAITGLLNSETRYNIKLSVARNFLRWQDYLQGGLQSYIGSSFRFSYGEGNYDMTSTMNVNGCLNEDYDGNELGEKEDIPVTTDFLHLAHLYEISYKMEWLEFVDIRNNRRHPIGVSQTDTGHVQMFIKTLEYKPVKGEVTILAWAKEYLDLSRVADTTPMQECYPNADDCADALTDSFGEILTDELGVCITE